MKSFISYTIIFAEINYEFMETEAEYRENLNRQRFTQ